VVSVVKLATTEDGEGQPYFCGAKGMPRFGAMIVDRQRS
jgi:hypothetical protein